MENCLVSVNSNNKCITNINCNKLKIITDSIGISKNTEYQKGSIGDRCKIEKNVALITCIS